MFLIFPQDEEEEAGHNELGELLFWAVQLLTVKESRRIVIPNKTNLFSENMLIRNLMVNEIFSGFCKEERNQESILKMENAQVHIFVGQPSSSSLGE